MNRQQHVYAWTRNSIYGALAWVTVWLVLFAMGMVVDYFYLSLTDTAVAMPFFVKNLKTVIFVGLITIGWFPLFPKLRILINVQGLLKGRGEESGEAVTAQRAGSVLFAVLSVIIWIATVPLLTFVFFKAVFGG